MRFSRLPDRPDCLIPAAATLPAMKVQSVQKQARTIAGFDVGGAHLKVTRAEDGRIVRPGPSRRRSGTGSTASTRPFATQQPLYAGADLNAFTMTGELSDIFPSRDRRRGLLDRISAAFSERDNADLRRPLRLSSDAAEAARKPVDVASANWHATASLVARLTGNALFVDMGSTTTDIIATRAGTVANDGYTDAERLLSGELVYTGFTQDVPVRRHLVGAGAGADDAADERIFRLDRRRPPHPGRARRERRQASLPPTARKRRWKVPSRGWRAWSGATPPTSTPAEWRDDRPLVQRAAAAQDPRRGLPRGGKRRKRRADRRRRNRPLADQAAGRAHGAALHRLSPTSSRPTTGVRSEASSAAPAAAVALLAR